MSIMLAFFDGFDRFDGHFRFKTLLSIRNTFTKDTIRPKTGIEAQLPQGAVKAQLPEYTPNPVPNRPIVQCQSPSVHFPELQSPTVDRLHSSRSS